MLLEAGQRPVLLDNFSNSSQEALRWVAELAGLQTTADQERLQVMECKHHSPAYLVRAISAGDPVTAVIHIAGLKVVLGESVQLQLCFSRWDEKLEEPNLGELRSTVRPMDR